MIMIAEAQGALKLNTGMPVVRALWITVLAAR